MLSFIWNFCTLGLFNILFSICLIIGVPLAIYTIYLMYLRSKGKEFIYSDSGNKLYLDNQINSGSEMARRFIGCMIIFYLIGNGFNTPYESMKIHEQKKIAMVQDKNNEEQQKTVEMPIEKTQEQIQAEINEQRIRNAKNWCSKLKSIINAEEKNWNLFMDSDSTAEMRVIYDFMRDSAGSIPDIPNDSPEEIQSEMIEAKRLTESVFKSRIAVMDSLYHMAQDRENWYRYNEEIAEQTRIVYQDTKQEVNQIYSILEDIISRL